MTRKCIVCKKELPEDSILPVCEYHKGIAAESAKRAAAGAVTLTAAVAVAAKDQVVPIIKNKALPAVIAAARSISKL